jgi:NADPH-dependent 2,4-dienoyl-CoA reductase/sulfur reductase-like enzyme
VVVATGANPRRLPGTDGLEGVRMLRTLDDSLELRRQVLAAGEGGRVVVVGAGFIGSEVASTCAGLGSEVTVLEALDTPLENALGPVVGAACGAMHERNGVALRTGTGVAAVRPGDRGLAVELTNGSALVADVVVVGIGVVPETGWLDGSGLTVGNGVECDQSLFCAERVVACGDLARWRWHGAGEGGTIRIEHWQLAAEMGVAAARSLLAGRGAAEAFDPLPYFWSDQYGTRIQSLGYPNRTDDVELVQGSYEEGKFVVCYGRDGRLSAALAVGMARQLMGLRPLLVAGATFDEGLAAGRA